MHVCSDATEAAATQNVPCTGSNFACVASRPCWQAGKTGISYCADDVKLRIHVLSGFYQVFNRLQKLGLCLSPFATLKLLDSLGEGHDEKICEWQASLVGRIEASMKEQVSHNAIMLTGVRIGQSDTEHTVLSRASAHGRL